MLKIGNYEISMPVVGTFRLDGGAMFGSVPKNIWNKKIAADAENCIALATRILVIRGAGRTILLDVGLGEKWSTKPREIFAIQNRPTSDWGFNPNEVTDVILTHLHFDHAGGVSRFKSDSQSEVELCFPNATHYLQRSNFENALAPSPRERASYLKENCEILKSAKLVLLDGDTEILPNIWGHCCNGHTVGQQWIEISDKENFIAYPTDLIPTVHHVSLPYTMGYDIHAALVMEEKKMLLDTVVKRNGTLIFEHDIETAMAKVAVDSKGNYTATPYSDVGLKERSADLQVRS
jgi:glyoxylase-like metal-dependent hydrolase (beta-lactamase superfamily II)